MVGSQSGVAHALIEAALSADPPLRLITNSDAYTNVLSGLEHRTDAMRPQRQSAAAADAEFSTAP